MTAAELYEIVKDVPREAWPDALWYLPQITCGNEVVMRADGAWRERPSDQFVSDTTAELAFVGSMTAFKARQFETVVYNQEGTTKHTVSQGVTEWEGDSLVAALAAACKEAA